MKDEKIYDHQKKQFMDEFFKYLQNRQKAEIWLLYIRMSQKKKNK